MEVKKVLNLVVGGGVLELTSPGGLLAWFFSLTLTDEGKCKYRLKFETSTSFGKYTL